MTDSSQLSKQLSWALASAGNEALPGQTSETPSRWTWATVVQVNPLRLRMDGDSAALAATPVCLCPQPAVNARVWVQIHGTQIIIHGATGVPYAVAAGGLGFGNFSNQYYRGGHVTFPVGRFTVPPSVISNLASAPGGSTGLVPRVLNTTATGCDIYLYTATGQSITTNSGETPPLWVNWIAIQMKPNTASG